MDQFTSLTSNQMEYQKGKNFVTKRVKKNLFCDWLSNDPLVRLFQKVLQLQNQQMTVRETKTFSKISKTKKWDDFLFLRCQMKIMFRFFFSFLLQAVMLSACCVNLLLHAQEFVIFVQVWTFLLINNNFSSNFI